MIRPPPLRKQPLVTPRQRETLATIRRLSFDLGFSPSIRELCRELNVVSTNGMKEALDRLIAAGWLTHRAMTARSFRLTPAAEQLLEVGT